MEMNSDLSKQHFDAHRKLRGECDQEDSRNDGELIFVLPYKLSLGIGEKTFRILKVGK